MKRFRELAIVIAVAVLTTTAQSQACYTPITSFQGTYSLSGSASGACFDGESGTCTTNESAAGTVLLNDLLASCSQLEQIINNGTITSASVNDTENYQCSDNPPTEQTDTVQGSGGAPGFALDQTWLNILVSSGTYSFSPFPYGEATESQSGCTNDTDNAPFPLYPNTTPYPTFSLPNSVQALAADNFKFTGNGGLNTTVPWTLSFSLTPVYDCKDCREDGDDPSWILPVSSSISPENGSLGEDLPVVDTPFQLHYESGRAPGAGKDPIATADAAMLGGWTFNVHHAFDPSTNTLFLGDGSERSGYELGSPVSLNGNYLLTSEDGSGVYVFNGTTGEHQQTLRPMTGAVEYTFGYDSAGMLTTITDVAGNVTTIQRNSSEQATAIVSPYGQTTTLAVDNNGFLNQVTDPLGNSSNFQNSSTGLLQSRADANGNQFNYTYNGSGQLIEDADPLGGFVLLAQTPSGSGFGWTANQTTSLGRTSSFTTTMTLPWTQDGSSSVSEQHTNIWPDGLQASSTKSLNAGQLSSSYTLPDGTSNSTTYGPDPRWGLQVPVTTSETISEGSLTMNITGSRTATVKAAGNPFTLETQTDSQTVNGRTYNTVFTASKRTFVETTPVGRKLTTVLDTDERVSETRLGSLTASDYTYDTLGRLSTVTQGTRKTTLAYDADGRVATITDPLTLTTSFGYDADGHFTSTTLADGRIIGYAYDADGDLTSVVPPGKSGHTFSYTAVGERAAYTPPTVPGTGATTYTYDLDRDLTEITRPDGETIQFGYDSAGRLASLTAPTETIAYSYDPNTGNLSSASINNGETLAYGYNGPLPISSALTGTVAGTVSLSYSNNFWITSESINGANTINYTYDNDGLLTQAGPLTLTLSTTDGLITGTTLSGTTDTRKYDDFAELTGYTAKYGNSTLLSDTFTRDADGRIISKTETVGAKKISYSYSYDQSGRLTGVQENGSTISSYTYDTNSNRLTAITQSGSISATYDAQDRLLAYGNASYTYTANGELASQTVGSATTTYQYDVLGNLTNVTLPSGKAITWVIDPRNRRVGKMVNGSLTEGFVYDGDRIVAQVNTSSAIVSRFVYGTGSTSPDCMVSGGVTYRIFSDQLGSPRLVVNTSTGAIAEQISYDEFGNVLSDTNPGFQPFGFAGGLYDQDTKLVRFGSRDYNPAIGRWTAKDPILFAGGDSNLYGYVVNDPVNMTDPAGLEGCECKKKSFIAGFIDSWINAITSPVTMGPLPLVIRLTGGVGITGNTGEALRNQLGIATDVDTGSTPYVIGALVPNAIGTIISAGAGVAGGGTGGGTKAVIDDVDKAATEFIEQQFGKGAEDIVTGTAKPSCPGRIIRGVPGSQTTGTGGWWP
jgi:RHS repeat-associated protein